MQLSKFYQFIYGHAKITIKKGRKALYHGPLNSIPDDLDTLPVQDFEGTNTGFIFYVK